MAISTYSELQTAIANWLHRDSDQQLIAVIPDFITNAELRLSSDLNARDMDTRLTLSTSAEYITLPSDLVESRRVWIEGNPGRVLVYLTPDQLQKAYPTTYTAMPVNFTIIGEQMQLAPAPDAAYDLELTYKQRIPALSDASPTNWLLTKYPNTYLYAALCEAQAYIMGDGRLPVWEAKYKQAVDIVNSIDWYSGSTMVMQSDSFRG